MIAKKVSRTRQKVLNKSSKYLVKKLRKRRSNDLGKCDFKKSRNELVQKERKKSSK